MPTRTPGLVVLFACVTALGFGCATPKRKQVRWSGSVSYLYGPVRGKLQTPTGGRPGTTTTGRPMLKELGITHAGMTDIAVAARWSRHEVYGGYRLFRLGNTATLEDPLVSQGRSFPAGTEVDSAVGLDWFRAGYRYWLEIDLPGEKLSDLAVAPAAGFAIWSFDYKLDADSLPDVHRNYIRPTPQLGLEAAYPLTGALSLTAGMLTSVPLGRQPRIFSGHLGGRYRLVERGGLAIDAELGVGFDRIDYRNSGRQSVPNDITVDAGPLLIGGIVARF